MSPYLGEDLVGEIFERLPSKSLMRFRCISKSWYSRIASPDFIRKHRLRSSQKVLIRRYSKYHWRDDVKDLYRLLSVDQFPLYPGLEYFDTPTTKFPCNLPKIVNSCNGIFCLHDYKVGISLWNPSIRRKLTIPNQPFIVNSFWGRRLAVGMGFDPISNDYKIVRICYFDYQEIVESSLVYSMKTCGWSSIASPATTFDHVNSQACFVNGVLHWVACRWMGDSLEHHIMTFNFSTHVFGKIMLRNPMWITRKIAIIDGCLSVYAHENEDTCCILVMKEYANVASWDVLLRMKCGKGSGEIKRVMQLNNTGYFLITNFGGGLEVYNPKTELRFALFDTKLYKVFTETCLESLELLDSGEVVS
ncbi:F-box/kelch-repeat protein-like protein [Tanacetum coccineum]